MVRRSFRFGLRLGMLAGILVAIARLVQARRGRAEVAAPWRPPAPEEVPRPVVAAPPPLGGRPRDVAAAPEAPPPRPAARVSEEAAGVPDLAPRDDVIEKRRSAPVRQQPATEPPAGDAPAAEPPAEEPPVTDAAPPLEAPGAGAPATEAAPAAGAPDTEAPGTDAAPAAEAPVTGAPTAQGPAGAGRRPARRPTGTQAAGSRRRRQDDGQGRAWVEPSGPTCPPSYPVKAKLSSGLFHLPGMLAYNRTKPDRCYRDAATAEADGLTQAKR